MDNVAKHESAYILHIGLNGYRPMEIAMITGVRIVKPKDCDPRPCFEVQYADRVLDYIAISDAMDENLYVIGALQDLCGLKERRKQFDGKIRLKIVVNGQETEVAASSQWNVGTVSFKALQQTGNTVDWNGLRTREGKEYDPDITVWEAELNDGDLLFLSLNIGIGG